MKKSACMVLEFSNHASSTYLQIITLRMLKWKNMFIKLIIFLIDYSFTKYYCSLHYIYEFNNNFVTYIFFIYLPLLSSPRFIGMNIIGFTDCLASVSHVWYSQILGSSLIKSSNKLVWRETYLSSILSGAINFS